MAFHPALFAPLDLGAWRLAHRIVMPALAGRRAGPPPGVPTEAMASFYADRASAGGLIVCEAASVSPGIHDPAVPGLYSAAQVNHWRRVTDAVHARGGIVLAQLGHGGRHAAAAACAGGDPGLDEIESVLVDYRNAAENAGDAGFDGVELQAAGGALPQRLLVAGGSRRAAGYGPAIEARSRLLREAVQALASVWGAERVGVCLAPVAAVDGDTAALYGSLLAELARQRIAYLQLLDPRADVAAPPAGLDMHAAETLRPHFAGRLIAAGGFSPASAAAAMDRGCADAVAFGRAFLAYPDLPARVRQGLDVAVRGGNG